MAKKTIEIELPDIKIPQVSDTTVIYLLAGILILSNMVNSYYTIQVNDNIQALNNALAGMHLQTAGDGTELQDEEVQQPGDEAVGQNAQQPEPEPEIIEVSADDDAVRGPENAPVTIIEFSDYQCPFCGRAEATINQILETYPTQVKVIFRDFPLGFHQHAQKAAEAAECAGEQGKYWEMHDKLFENQRALDVDSLKKYAAEIGLDTETFNSCLDNGDMASEVQKDFQDGQAAGVSGTPTFFINGEKLVGAQPFSAFKAVIDSKLAG